MNRHNSTVVQKRQLDIVAFSGTLIRELRIKKLCSIMILSLVLATMMNAGVVNAQTFDFKFGTNGSGDGQFERPAGVAVDGSGDIYVADTGNHRIQKFDPDGSFILKFGTRGSGDGQFMNPTGVAVDSSSNIYVADTGNQRIQLFATEQTLLPGSGDGFNKDGGGCSVASVGSASAIPLYLLLPGFIVIMRLLRRLRIK